MEWGICKKMIMDKKTKDGIIIASIVLVGGYLLYKNKPKTKADYVYNISTKLSTSASTLNTFDLGFLQAWSDAIDTSKDSFTYNGRNYNGKTGKAIV